MALNMTGNQGYHIKQLSKYIATIIYYTRNGIVTLLIPFSYKA